MDWMVMKGLYKFLDLKIDSENIAIRLNNYEIFCILEQDVRIPELTLHLKSMIIAVRFTEMNDDRIPVITGATETSIDIKLSPEKIGPASQIYWMQLIGGMLGWKFKATYVADRYIRIRYTGETSKGEGIN